MLRIDQLKKSFGARVLFAGASYHFPEGERVALVGANGAGKTTLLNILCGLDQPDDGKVLIPGNASIGYLPQTPNLYPEATVLAECEAGAVHLINLRRAMEKAIERLEDGGDDAALHAYEEAETAFRLSDGYALESKAQGILNGLGFTEEDLVKSPLALSGGWRMRLELARLFLRDPSFLILDEPTNHLDLPSLMWVEQYLQTFRGTLLFVSHDRALLNRLATITLHLANARLQPYRGNFDAFLLAREERMNQEEAERGQLRQRREQMEKFVDRFGAKASKAAQAQSRVKMIARIREVEDTMAPEGSDDTVFINLPLPARTPRLVYRVEDGSVGYTKPLSRKLNLQIERGHKIAIIGANGIGKSTFLRTVAGRQPELAGLFAPSADVEIAYFAQEQRETLDMQATVLQNLLAAGDLGEREARRLLGGFLFRGDDVFKQMKVLSGGEQSRLGLACSLAKRANLLLLDEPTNHLDMASVETLAASLDDYTGTLLFVSHDRSFIDSVCTHVFAMLADGRSMLFTGKLADYERLAEIAGFPNVLKTHKSDAPKSLKRATQDAAVSVPSKESHASGTLSPIELKDQKRQEQKIQSRIKSLELDMAKARRQIAGLDEAMAIVPGSDFSKTAALHQEQQALAVQLETHEMEWMTLSEEFEGLVSKRSSAKIGK